MLDSAANFVQVQASTGYNSSATAVTLQSGQGAKLPAAPFNLVWWNSTDYPNPATDPNVEIVRVTGIASDTITITRAQESTSATSKNTSSKTYSLVLGITAKVISDIGALVDGVLPSQTGHSGKFLTTDGTDTSWDSPSGGGDMLAATYDPQNIASDAFDQDNMTDGTTNKNYTATEKSKLAAISGTNTGDETTSSIKTKLGITTLSGDNTGDQTTVTGNAGTATKLATARNIDGQSFDGSADITVIAPGTHAATSKTTPVDADELPIVDSAASNVLKKLTWANLYAALASVTQTFTHKTFDTAGTGNSFKINGTAVSAVTGSGSAVLGTSPTITTPVINEIDPASSTSLKVNAGLYTPIQTYTPTAAGTATLDLSKGNIHHVTMPAGNITIALSNATAGQCFMVRILQDSSGSRTVTWFSTIKWVGGTAPTLTTTASKADTLGFEVTGSGTYDGYIIGQNI